MKNSQYNVCSICNKDIDSDDKHVAKSKALKNLRSISLKIKDELRRKWPTTLDELEFHKNCYNKYTSPNNVSAEIKELQKKHLSPTEHFWSIAI